MAANSYTGRDRSPGKVGAGKGTWGSMVNAASDWVQLPSKAEALSTGPRGKALRPPSPRASKAAACPSTTSNTQPISRAGKLNVGISTRGGPLSGKIAGATEVGEDLRKSTQAGIVGGGHGGRGESDGSFGAVEQIAGRSASAGHGSRPTASSASVRPASATNACSVSSLPTKAENPKAGIRANASGREHDDSGFCAAIGAAGRCGSAFGAGRASQGAYHSAWGGGCSASPRWVSSQHSTISTLTPRQAMPLAPPAHRRPPSAPAQVAGDSRLHSHARVRPQTRAQRPEPPTRPLQ